MHVLMSEDNKVLLPDEVIESLGLGPGDLIGLEQVEIDGRTSWVLRPKEPDMSWFGSLRSYAIGKSHDMEDIRRSIVEAKE